MAVSGCYSAHKTTLKTDTGYNLFAIDERTVFEIVYVEFRSAVDDALIEELDGPERGFRTTLTFGLDEYDLVVRIIPAEGELPDGTSVSGYFVELAGKGTFPTSTPRKLMQAIEERLQETGTATTVSSYRPAEYVLQRQRWRLSENPDSPTEVSSPAERLQHLEKLLEKGLISEDEYTVKRRQIIEQL